jgi:two-component system CheB/CheR fusion protein
MARQDRGNRTKPLQLPKQTTVKRKVATPAPQDPDPGPRPPCPVVGVGASAGGLGAFQSFLSGVPADTGIAFVLVQHLSPEHKSMLEELLRRHATMPVAEVTQDTPIEANRIYVIPPNATLTIQGANLHLAPAAKRVERMPIDEFFGSLALALGERAACVILSGTGSDGTLGLRAIKEHGGLSLAQTEASAKYDGMLRSAIATGLVDHVLPPERMAAKLIEYFQHLNEIEGDKDAGGVSRHTAAHLDKILAVLATRTKHDFSGYKEPTVGRRVQRRMQALQISSPDQYINRLRSEPREVGLLFQDLLIGVTNYFRDPGAFAALDKSVIAHLMQNSKDSIRVWVPGCSTGEEAYSIGILLRERMAQVESADPPKLQIFATDIDGNALETARSGRYSPAIAKDLSPERLERFFVKDDGVYRVTQDVREMCIFSLHNALRDPPFSKLDLISCRNLMIYLNAPIQDRLLQMFHYALRPGGFLFLGTTEGVGQQPGLFAPVDKEHHIFGWLPHADVAMRFPVRPTRGTNGEATPELPRAKTTKSHLELAERVVLGYAPAYVIVNSERKVLSFSPRTGKYLEPSIGAPSTDLLLMARQGLRLQLRVALNKAMQTGRRAAQANIAVDTDGGSQTINLIVEPLGAGSASETFYAVIFQDIGGVKLESEEVAKETSPDDADLRQLENELRQTREQHQIVTEDLEATNEELNSSNEELSSMIEELQSTSEELETSKEELQSLNEELLTVNSQVQITNDDLLRANSDLKNLLESTQIATMFLDGELKIKGFTPSMADIFNVIAGDHGRPITHIRSRLTYGDIERDAQQVMRSLSFVEREVDLIDNSAHYVMRIRPYRTINDVIDGVVITFFDITQRKRAETALNESEARFRAMADGIPAFVWMCDDKGECTFLNKQWSAFTGRPLQDELRRGFLDSIHPDDRARHEEVERDILARRAQATDEFRLRGKDGQYRWFLDTMVPRFAADSTYLGHLGVLIDIDDRRKLEEQLRQVQRLEAVGQLAGGVAHDFNNLLTVVIGNLDLIRDFPDKTKNVVQYSANALQASQRGVELVRRMAAFSRQQVLKPRMIEMNRLIADMARLLQRSLSANIKIDIRLADDLWTARADPGQVEDSFLNLALNARDAMPDGGRIIIETANVTLDADLAARESELTPGDYTMLSVSDTGMGMTPEVLARAVQPFFTTKDVGKGSGLGLSMVYGFAKQSGGHLKIYSEAGHGCAVKLYLPRFVGPVEAPPEPTRATPTGGSETILVVEDDELVCDYVVGQLKSLGYDILEAKDGSTALAMISGGRRIDLLFSDVMLPGGMLGPQLLEQARAHLPGLKALLTSGYSEATILPRRIGEVVQLLQKPYSRKDLATQIRAVLDGKTG